MSSSSVKCQVQVLSVKFKCKVLSSSVKCQLDANFVNTRRSGLIFAFLDTYFLAIFRINRPVICEFGSFSVKFGRFSDFRILENRSNVSFTSRVFSKPSSWMKELGEIQWIQDRILHQAAIIGDSVTDQRQAANCECSSLFPFPFRSLASWIPGRCVVHFFLV